MNANDAFRSLVGHALENCGDSLPDRLAVYDAAAVVAFEAGMLAEHLAASNTANALRGAETMELNFRRSIQGGAR